MITAREAQEIANGDLSAELYWAGKVARKIRSAAGDKDFKTELHIYDREYIDSPKIREFVQGILVAAGFKVTQTDTDHTTLHISWETQNVGSVPHGENGGGAGV